MTRVVLMDSDVKVTEDTSLINAEVHNKLNLLCSTFMSHLHTKLTLRIMKLSRI